MTYRPDRNTCKFCPDDFEDQQASDGTLTNALAGVSTLTLRDDPFPSLKTPRSSFQSSRKTRDLVEDVINQVSSGSLTVLAQPGVGISSDGSGRVSGPRELMLTDIHRVDYGTFGTIYRAFLLNGKKVAIKKVLQHSNYRNRELTILKELNHPNIVTLFYFFYTKGEEPGSDYLHLVMEFFNSNLARLIRHHRDKKTPIPMVQIKCLMYQMFRGLNYLHYQDIGHRDIKPHNLLLDPQTCVLKVCDFGCAKKLAHNETSISYICSRYYRPPELCMGATQYGVNIDMWSGGCVVAEMFLGEPVFRGSSREDQMVEIIKVLGTPNKEQMREMKVYEPPFRLPKLDRISWSKVFRHARTMPPRDGMELVNQILRYTPGHRLTAATAMTHSFFSDLRSSSTRLPGGLPLPKMFNFTEEELKHEPALGNLTLTANGSHHSNIRPASSIALFRRLSQNASGTRSRRSQR